MLSPAEAQWYSKIWLGINQKYPKFCVFIVHIYFSPVGEHNLSKRTGELNFWIADTIFKFSIIKSFIFYLFTELNAVTYTLITFRNHATFLLSLSAHCHTDNKNIHCCFIASSPPTTSAKPITTEASMRVKQVWSDVNSTVHGNPSSLTKFYAEKGIRLLITTFKRKLVVTFLLSSQKLGVDNEQALCRKTVGLLHFE